MSTPRRRIGVATTTPPAPSPAAPGTPCAPRASDPDDPEEKKRVRRENLIRLAVTSLAPILVYAIMAALFPKADFAARHFLALAISLLTFGFISSAWKTDKDLGYALPVVLMLLLIFSINMATHYANNPEKKKDKTEVFGTRAVVMKSGEARVFDLATGEETPWISLPKGSSYEVSGPGTDFTIVFDDGQAISGVTENLPDKSGPFKVRAGEAQLITVSCN